MMTTTILRASDQATLFMPDLEAMHKEFGKKTYTIKRLIFDRLNTLIDDLDLSKEAEWRLRKELDSIISLKKSAAEKAPLQAIITIKDFSKSEQALIDAVAKRYKEDPEFLTRLGQALD